MKTDKIVLILVLGLSLCACGRSKQAQFYMLNPLPQKHLFSNHLIHLKIGIDAINTPAFAEKPQLLIYDTSNQVQLEEFHQWAESLDKNIKQVIKTNLNMLLPGAIIEESPWNIKFKPDYTLQIDISEFKIDRLGNSSLRARYLVFYHGKQIKKYDTFYHVKLSVVTVEALVNSMNRNLNQFTQFIAKTLSR